MIKYFHELTVAEFNKLTEQHMTWKDCSELYPQPTWCDYPEAVMGPMGCWSLMFFRITGESFCRNCECYKGKQRRILIDWRLGRLHIYLHTGFQVKFWEKNYTCTTREKCLSLGWVTLSRIVANK